MKKLAILAVFVFTLILSTNAFAAKWELVDTVKDSGLEIKVLVDKDSIRKGTASKKFPKYNRSDGFSAIVKFDMKIEDNEKKMHQVEATNLYSFYEENGVRKYTILESYDKNGKIAESDEKDILTDDVDAKDSGKEFPIIWEFIQKKLK